MFIAGVHVPVMGVVLVLEVASGGIVAPAQYGPTCVNVGVMVEVTLTVIVAVLAHWFVPGVNV